MRVLVKLTNWKKKHELVYIVSLKINLCIHGDTGGIVKKHDILQSGLSVAQDREGAENIISRYYIPNSP